LGFFDNEHAADVVIRLLDKRISAPKEVLRRFSAAPKAIPQRAKGKLF
jgi:hypothetical protein